MNAQAVADYLNRLCSLDPAFVDRLVNTRFDCNLGVAVDPCAQVYEHAPGVYRAGFLGALNGALIDCGVLDGKTEGAMQGCLVYVPPAEGAPARFVVGSAMADGTLGGECRGADGSVVARGIVV